MSSVSTNFQFQRWPPGEFTNESFSRRPKVWESPSYSASFFSGAIIGVPQIMSGLRQIKFDSTIKTPRPVSIHREVNLDEWENALSYGDEEKRDLAEKLLVDFDIAPNEGNMELLGKLFTEIISSYEKEYNVTLTDDQREMLKTFAMKSSYDLLHVR